MSEPKFFTPLRSWASSRVSHLPIPQVTFAETEVAAPAPDFEVGTLGGALRVPARVCAAITTNSPRPRLYGPGDYYITDLRPGRYAMQYVDLSRRTTRLPAVQAGALDSLGVRLVLDVTWQVVQPALALAGAHPVSTLAAVCQAAARDFIHTHRHDELVGVDEVPALAGPVLAQAMRQALAERPACAGLAVLDVVIADCQGDPQRIAAVTQAGVERARIDQEKHLLQHKVELERQRQALVLQQAENKRKAAEEEDRVRLQQAETSAEEARRLHPLHVEEIELQRLEAETRQGHELALRSLDVLGQLAAAALQAQAAPLGLVHAQAGGGGEVLAQAVQALAGQLGPAGPAPQPLRRRLALELADLLEGSLASAGGFEAGGPDECRLNVRCQELHLRLVYGPEHPQLPPQVYLARAGNGSFIYQPLPVDWRAGMSLGELVQSALQAARAQAPGGQSHPVAG